MTGAEKTIRPHPESVLLVTLDSCRYDSFAAARMPNARGVGPLHRAEAPSYFTYGSHAAMFVGFTPGIASRPAPYLNPKYAKLFKIVGQGLAGLQPPAFELRGRTIMQGFARLGYATVGSGAVRWFDPRTETGKLLTQDFNEFYYPGDVHSLGKQVAVLEKAVAEAGARPVFAFLNVGETHVPYFHAGAPWSPDRNPCIPFAEGNDAAECAMRQRQCAEFADRLLGPLLSAFADATILLCADHGDCWGEDGLWEHGMHHRLTLEVPLLLRVRGRPVA